MKLLVTDNLVSDLSQLDSFNINLEKISIKDIPNQAQSLFDDDKFKFIFDEFITISSFNKLKIDLDDNYIFQIKKSNLSKFTSLGSEVDVLYLDSQKKENYFPWDLTNLIYRPSGIEIRHVQGLELLAHPSGTDTEQHAPTGQLVSEIGRAHV